MNLSSGIEIISQRLEVEAPAPHIGGRKALSFLVVRSLVKNYAPSTKASSLDGNPNKLTFFAVLYKKSYC